jgi:phenylpyruvate tautomerase PptA (4-oxalocrotonate tautomerase family)
MDANVSVDEARRFGVHRAIRRIQRVTREVARRLQHQLDAIAIVIGEVRQREHAGEVEHLVEEHLDVAVVDESIHALGRRTTKTAPRSPRSST